MVNVTINGKPIAVEKGTTILDAATANGIMIPTLCFLKDINEIGACRICVVEIEGMERLAAACNNTVEEGMVIYTNSPKVMASRKSTLELILSEHEYSCATCTRCGNCRLQALAEEFGLSTDIYKKKVRKIKWNRDFPLIRDNEKCIKCMRCIQVCNKVQALGIWDVCGTGARTTVDVKGGLPIDQADCAVCGQCITHCPVGALHERDDKNKLYSALADPDTVKIVQVAPAVRAAWGEELGLAPEDATMEKMGEALRQIGFDYVFDTNFSADLTIMEEGSEFLHRLSDKAHYTFPMFTSCCPGWVRFIRTQYPDMVPQLSTAKSPQQMFGAVVKSYLAEKLGKDPKDIYSVSVMPCIAKKAEAAYENMGSEERGQDVDLVLTTRELIKLIKAANINVAALEDKPLDDPLCDGTGAAVIFGTTGGVMEAALRTVYAVVTGEEMPRLEYEDVRGFEGVKISTVNMKGTEVKVCVAHGIANAKKVVELVKAGKMDCQFIEVMACPGGCIGGGGNPPRTWKIMEERKRAIYEAETKLPISLSHRNPSIRRVYESYLGEPCGHLSHRLLHTRYFNRQDLA